MNDGPRVPWNAAWSGEEAFEIRPCRWSKGELAMHQKWAPGAGKPLFAKPHLVRQRRSVVEMRCTVCGDLVPAGDRYWFRLGEFMEASGRTWFTTQEAPVHLACAHHSLNVCPHLRHRAGDLERFPEENALILASLIGGPKVEEDFGIHVAPGRKVIGAMKYAWPYEPTRTGL